MTLFEYFLTSYTETATWSSTDLDGTPLDDIDAGLSQQALDQFKADCQAFYDAEIDKLDLSLSDVQRAGHDFWLTRNRHGAGFWDGDWPEALGEHLTEASHAWGSLRPLRGRRWTDLRQLTLNILP